MYFVHQFTCIFFNALFFRASDIPRPPSDVSVHIYVAAGKQFPPNLRTKLGGAQAKNSRFREILNPRFASRFSNILIAARVVFREKTRSDSPYFG